MTFSSNILGSEEKNNNCSEENAGLQLAHVKYANHVSALPQLTMPSLGLLQAAPTLDEAAAQQPCRMHDQEWGDSCPVVLLPQSALWVPPVCWGQSGAEGLDRPVGVSLRLAGGEGLEMWEGHTMLTTSPCVAFADWNLTAFTWVLEIRTRVLVLA